MSPDIVLSIVVVALGAAAVLVVIGSRQAHSRPGPRSIEGHLDREARSRDRHRWGTHRTSGSQRLGREAERAVALARREGSFHPAFEPSAPPAQWTPPDGDELGVTRRQFLNRSILGAMVLSLSGFGASLLAFLWPSSTGGFGSKISIGSTTSVDETIAAGSGFGYYPEGRMWVVPYPPDSLPKAKAVYSAPELVGMEAGYVALYQKCVHLGCRVPACLTSQWFECPCHGSQYSHVGEKKGGPAPRGLDRFPITVASAGLTVNTGQIILGPPIGTDTTGQDPEGPHCVTTAGG